MRARLHSSLIAVLALTCLLAACAATGPNPIVDGWPIGERLDCSRSACARYLTVAAAGLDRRNPGHAAIVASALYDQGTYELEDGTMYLAVCSGGCPSVAVFKLLDGSTRAIGVGTPGISVDPMAVDWGPALAGEP